MSPQSIPFPPWRLRANFAMRLMLAIAVLYLASFAFGAVISFLSAYLFGRPDAKFTGRGAFQIGLMVSAWMSVCLVVTFALTLPLYRRLFGDRSTRHILIYTGVFLVVGFVLFQSPPMGALMQPITLGIVALTRNEIAQLILISIGRSALTALFFSGFLYLAIRISRGLSSWRPTPAAR